MRWVGYQFNTSATTFRFLDWQQRVWLPSVCSTSKSPRPFTANTEPCQLRREPVAKKLEQKCADGRFCRLVRISILQVLFQRLQFPDIPRYRVRSELEVAVRWLRGLPESGPSSFHHWFHRPPQDMPIARCNFRSLLPPTTTFNGNLRLGSSDEKRKSVETEYGGHPTTPSLVLQLSRSLGLTFT